MGYRNVSYFAKIFKKYYKTTPLKFRCSHNKKYISYPPEGL
ncbi:hypothetical protein [Mobilisporobacter senegalensis]